MQDIKVFEQFFKELKFVEDFRHINFPKTAGCYISHRKNQLNRRRVKKKQRLNPFNLNENQFRIKYRFTKENLRRIIEIVRDDLEVDYDEHVQNNQVPVELQILCAIRLWGGTEHPEMTAMAHGVSLRTMAKITRRVATALSSKASRYIRMPATLSEKELVVRSFQDLANMPQVIGALVQTSVRFRNESRQNESTYSEGNDSVTTAQEHDFLHLQVVCDATHKIRDLDMRLSDELDSNTGMEMFSLSRIKERFEQNEFRGRILLGNNETLSCSSCLLTPVRCPRHLSEELYNRAHATTFSPAIQCINLWFYRFGILANELLGSFGSAKQTITALALLHNMAMEWNDASLEMENKVCFYEPNFLNYTWDDNNHLQSEHRARKEFINSHFPCM